MTRLVSLSNVSVAYDQYEALQNVYIDIYSADFLGVIGPNGGGKTTLVKAILGFLPYSGTITYDNALNSLKTKAIGYLPQQNDFDRSFPISVGEVVLSGLQNKAGLLKCYTKQDRQSANAILELAGLKELITRPIGNLSGGQIQRALLCRAVVSQPKLLILDEPTNSLDEESQTALCDFLKKLNRQMAIIMVSHDSGTIANIAKNIVYVNRRVTATKY